jgi:BASS family bile acid:Na+ symporter
MRAIIQEAFQALLAVVIPLASFTTGLKAPRPGGSDERLWRRSGLLLRALLAGLILVPLWVLFLVRVLPLSPPLRAGLLLSAIAVGIGPAASMKRMGEGTAMARLALELNLVVLILSLVFVPVAFAALVALYHVDFHLRIGAVAKVVLGRALIPLLLGLVAARRAPRLAAAAGPWLLKIVNVVLLIVVLFALIVTGKHLLAVGGVGWLACALTAVGAVVIGHALGGPDPGTRAVVAAESALRFPALALVLADALPQRARVLPVVLAYVLAALLAVTIYGVLMARRVRRRKPAVVGRAPIGARPRPA